MKNNNLQVILTFVAGLLIVIGLDILYIPSSSTKTIETKSITNDKALSIEQMKDNYFVLEKKTLETTFYSDFYDAVKNAKYGPTSFKGKLTHYGPDCVGCGGTTACRGQNVRNGNIYYNDKEYGKIRIVAADRSLPCGSIIKINIDKYDPDGMYAVVLDRGGIIKGAKIDLLKTSEKAKSPVRTINNASFDIIRLGYAKK